jgi:hypothetical protein
MKYIISIKFTKFPPSYNYNNVCIVALLSLTIKHGIYPSNIYVRLVHYTPSVVCQFLAIISTE